jgi:hypothetical protein
MKIAQAQYLTAFLNWPILWLNARAGKSLSTLIYGNLGPFFNQTHKKLRAQNSVRRLRSAVLGRFIAD